jgi:hypothetical protein
LKNRSYMVAQSSSTIASKTSKNVLSHADIFEIKFRFFM